MSVVSNKPPSRLPAEPFFLDAQPGKRFCIFHAPHPDKPCQGALIYVHPFAEEMNCSRHMAALQAKAFAERGVAVLLIDLYGCGDSAGDFGDARWEIWKTDLMIAKQWLESRLEGHLSAPIGLWGLRLGALLALDFARGARGAIGPIILWQPVINGKSFVTQFLRLRVAGEMLAAGGNSAGTQAMRSQLSNGEMLEVAGYDLAPDLVSAIDALDAATLWEQRVFHIASLHWFDIARTQGSVMSPSTAAVIDAWRRHAVDVKHGLLQGTPFWTMPESPDCPDLLVATSAVFAPSSDDPSAP